MTATRLPLTREGIAAAFASIPYLPAHDGRSYDHGNGTVPVRYAAFGPRIDVESNLGEIEVESLEEYDELVGSGAKITKATVYMYAVADYADNDERLAEMGGVDSPMLKGLAEASDFWPSVTFVA